MSVYASTFRSSGSVNLVSLESELEDYLPAREALYNIPGGVQSTSGTTDIFSQSATVAADDIVLFIYSYTCSATTAATTITLTSKVDGAASFVNSKMDLNNNASGIGESGFLFSPFKNPTAGSRTYSITMAITGGGTGYIANALGYVLTMKRRT